MPRYSVTRSIRTGVWSAIVEADSMAEAKKKADVGLYVEDSEDHDFDFDDDEEIVCEDDE